MGKYLHKINSEGFLKFEYVFHNVKSIRKQRKIACGIFCVFKSAQLSASKPSPISSLPEKMLATAAMMKLNTTPGPAICLATIPATKYMPVPQHDPTPSDVRSNVVKHFWNEHRKKNS